MIMAKLKNLYRTGITALALFLTLAACNNLTEPGAGTSRAGIQGMGTARINLNGGEARTAVPGIAGYYFTLEFTASGKSTINETLNGAMTVTVALEPAVWTLEVKGYADSAKTDLKLSGRTSVPITAGTDSSFDVYLTPDFSSGGKGSLSYNIGFPASARGWFALYPLDDTPGTSREIDISGTGGNASDTLTDLPEGAYRAVIDLYDSAANKSAAWTGVAHIGGGSTTALTRTFTAAGFADCDPPVAADTNTLAAKLDAALASPSGAYTIALDGTETDLTNFAPKFLGVTENKDITVTIRGGGNEVQLGSTNGNLFYLQHPYLSFGSSLKLVLQDITLRGRSDNDSSLVRVESRGTLEMQTGSFITGNTNTAISSSAYGGGVYVSGGTFNISGGAVSGNTSAAISSSVYGGGVYVSGGTFTMNGGAVSGNTVTSFYSSYGGGVYVYDGTFNMNGGVISGNSAKDGGGVSVGFNGTFAMSGGAVSDNTSSAYGGGVYISGGTFNMSGGAVSSNICNDGGGVYVDSFGTFSMNGGAVSGNTTFASGGGVYVAVGTFIMSDGTVSGNFANYGGSSGGGVCVYSSYASFNMNGGTVSGNTATSGGGVSVYFNGTFTMNGSAVSGNIAESGGGVSVGSNGTFTMSDSTVSGNTASSGGGVSVFSGIFIMSGSKVSDNTATSGDGGGVSFASGTFTMCDSTVSDNIASSVGGGVSANGTFTMNGGAVSGNFANYGGGVSVPSGTFIMSGGEVKDNLLISVNGFGREVVVRGTFKMSGDARPERIFLYSNTRFITISGPLSGGTVPIDLGITGSAPLANWVGRPVLVLDSSYDSGNLATLKDNFTLRNAKRTETSDAEMSIPANYKIGNDGKLTN
jgi:hypothetical protein